MKKREEKIKNTNVKETEWIWVEGYKGTNADMTCNGYQYELGKIHEMPEGSEIELCGSGFHFCKHLRSVFDYYAIGGGHRFFKVKALVRKEDWDDKYIATVRYITYSRFSIDDKFTSKAIEFISEVPEDDIFAAARCSNFTKKERKKALKHESGISAVIQDRREAKRKESINKLIEVGYSTPFADYIVHTGLFDVAYAVGSQADLSMDMKVLYIMHRRDD